MGARVTLTVMIPPATPVEGAEILAVNHDSWSASHREWQGRTESDGSFTWNNMDTGTLGDRYTFHVDYTAPDGVTWAGSISERIRSPVSLKLVLSPRFKELESISSSAERSLSRTPEGRRILGSLSELEQTLKGTLTFASIGLEVAILEDAIRLNLSESTQRRAEWDFLPLGVLVSLKGIYDRLEESLAERIRRLAATRNQIAHASDSGSLPQLAQSGLLVCLETLESLFGSTARKPERDSKGQH